MLAKTLLAVAVTTLLVSGCASFSGWVLSFTLPY
jgi:hypothetical protein